MAAQLTAFAGVPAVVDSVSLAPGTTDRYLVVYHFRTTPATYVTSATIAQFNTGVLASPSNTVPVVLVRIGTTSAPTLRPTSHAPVVPSHEPTAYPTAYPTEYETASPEYETAAPVSEYETSAPSPEYETSAPEYETAAPVSEYETSAPEYETSAPHSEYEYEATVPPAPEYETASPEYEVVVPTTAGTECASNCRRQRTTDAFIKTSFLSKKRMAEHGRYRCFFF